MSTLSQSLTIKDEECRSPEDAAALRTHDWERLHPATDAWWCIRCDLWLSQMLNTSNKVKYAFAAGEVYGTDNNPVVPTCANHVMKQALK